MRRNQRPAFNLELRRSKSHWRRHWVGQRRAQISGTLSGLEVSLWSARDSGRNPSRRDWDAKQVGMALRAVRLIVPLRGEKVGRFGETSLPVSILRLRPASR